MWMRADEANPRRTVVKSIAVPARSSTNVSPRARSSGAATSFLVGLVVQEFVRVGDARLHLGGLFRVVVKGLEVPVPGLVVEIPLGEVPGSGALVDVLRIEWLGPCGRILRGPPRASTTRPPGR